MSKDGFDPDTSHHYETVDLESIIDKDAYMEGYDKDGYDKRGYNKSGYDKNGFDYEGDHRVTNTKFDEKNIDKRGFNDTGTHGVTGTKFDENNFDTDCIHKVTGTLFDEDGFHANGLNEDGCDKDGYDEYCVDKNNFNRYGYRNKFYFDGTHGVTGTKFDENNFDTNDTHKVTGTKFDEDGYDVSGFDKDGFDKDGYDVSGFDKEKLNRDGLDFESAMQAENGQSLDDDDYYEDECGDPAFQNHSPDPYEDKEYIKEQFGTGKPFHPNDDEGDEEIRE